MSKTVVGLRVRLPVDAKAFIEAEAQENASSQNSEIIRAIRAAMKTKSPAESAIPPGHDQNHTTQMENGIDA